jgi:hypothetical protein
MHQSRVQYPAAHLHKVAVGIHPPVCLAVFELVFARDSRKEHWRAATLL